MQTRKKTVFFLIGIMSVSSTLGLPAFVDSASDRQYVDSDGGSSRPNHSQVLIIGAGPAGVAAASRLLENGILDITLLEAENRIGGRIHTIQFGENVVDLGAQWVHGVRDNVVYEMAAPLGLLQENGHTVVDNMRFMQGNGEVPDHNLLYHLFNISRGIDEDYASYTNYNGSYGQYFMDKFAEYTLNPTNNVNADPSLVFSFLTWMEKLSAFADGADSWFNVSAKGLAQYWECEGDQNINWRNSGYYSVINLLTKRFPHPAQELPVRRKTKLRNEVKTIHWGPSGVVGPNGKNGKKAVLVETSGGARYTADIVIVTVSLGVLKENANVMFNPPLHSMKTNAIQHIGFGQVDKIFMHFAETWWTTNITGFSILVTDDDRKRFNRLYPQYADKGEWLSSLTGFYLVPRQPHSVLFDWLVGEPARNMEKYSDYQVMVGCMRWLEMFADRPLPWPVSLTRSKWYSNPHFRGSYSYRSLDSENYDAQSSHLAEPLFGPDGTPEVLFAGEATSDHHYSTVHGAIETGWREADRILDLLGKENRSRKRMKTS